MDVMKGLLSIIRTTAPAKADATPAARAAFDRKLAAFRKANGIVDRCAVGVVCSRTGARFETLFERAAPDGLFARVSTRACNGGNEFAAAAPQTRRVFSVADLDLSGWACAGCRSPDFVHCQCGVNGCDPRPGHNESANLYKCPGCGSEARTVPLSRIETRQGGGIRSQSKTAQLRGAQSATLLPRR
jgi:hypothetical protein